MEITYAGGNSFSIGPSPIVAINPAEKVTEAVALRTAHRSALRELVSDPGEFEVRGVLVTAFPAGNAGADRLVFALNLDGINVLVIDGPASAVGKDLVETVGPVDVLMIDTGEAEAASQLVRTLAPRVTIPYGTNAASIAAMLGIKDAEAVARFTWNGISTVPKAVLLRESKGGKRAA